HVVPDMWYLMGVVLAAGGAFAWYRDQFVRELAGSRDINDRLDEEAASVPAGADGVTFLPYLQGERTPHRDASMRGAFLGLSLAHSRAHLTRAVVEGVCFALRDSLSILQEIGLAPAQMLLTGGGAKSKFVRRLQGEVFGVPVCTVNREEGPAFGAALLGAVGVRAFPNLAAATSAMLTRGQVAQATPAAHAAYDEAYRRFRGAYAAARPVALSPDALSAR
ncbi:MAG: FGGY-family carbohydrate kinase, partial [Gemmatimonadaceae bacterium]